MENKVALVTGSAKGLGKKTALALAELGCNVVVNFVHSKTEADDLVKVIKDMGVKSTAIQADVSKFEQLQNMILQIEEQFSGVDILVNNAGPYIHERKLFYDYSLEEMNYLVHGNFLSVMQLDHLVLPNMRKKKWGRIIHFGFGLAAESRGWPHRAVYAAAKVGLVSFTKTLSVEEAEYGITVNMICPGDIRGQNKEKEIKDVETVYDEKSPRGRSGTGEDVSRVITFLCQPQSDFITGNIMDISGGLDPIRPFR
ncbi:SDR family oxidoreductase [Chengkuizengella axinellae]|uniref:SDR family oxidoreductase n=1 Tax=Chengkuizengella axinellae TaxID=3064388 RepID=A0ABT9IT98_9BACL|nr:SDR family oxidoreductase [Chengkuizengella sp. 2205SS18-9]MDP5272568.1 SDR family oxidoreductase [Chengkuizengella sp. 2205SS18-9]